jgi:hypothetical protein
VLWRREEREPVKQKISIVITEPATTSRPTSVIIDRPCVTFYEYFFFHKKSHIKNKVKIWKEFSGLIEAKQNQREEF